MNIDPETESVTVNNGNMITVRTTDATVTDDIPFNEYTIVREDSGEWRILTASSVSR